jgi:hypothetical protein
MHYFDTLSARTEHPLDSLERMALLNDWPIARIDDDALCLSIAGEWSKYEISFTWIEHLETLHISASFPLTMPQRRRGAVAGLLSRINEQLLVGHFEYWETDQVVLFRHSLLLSGGADFSHAQFDMLAKIASETSDRYYQAFQYVLWTDLTPEQALEAVLFNTIGEA